MESVSDLLGRYQPQLPDEAVTIKRYIHDTFAAPSSVLVRSDAIVITVHSAALANTLRLRLPALQELTKTTKKLIFRIG